MTRHFGSGFTSYSSRQLVLAMLALLGCFAIENVVSAQVRKIDPRNGEFVEITLAQVTPGKIYNHYSPRHGRFVWAYAKEGGRFSYALGVGSTESPQNFDLVTTKDQTKEILKEEAGKWYAESRREKATLLVKLGADETWRLVRSRGIRSHFDLDSSRRWEWHGKRRVAVVHTYGSGWQYDGKRYAPGVASLTRAHDNCSHCGFVDLAFE